MTGNSLNFGGNTDETGSGENMNLARSFKCY